LAIHLQQKVLAQSLDVALGVDFPWLPDGFEPATRIKHQIDGVWPEDLKLEARPAGPVASPVFRLVPAQREQVVHQQPGRNDFVVSRRDTGIRSRWSVHEREWERQLLRQGRHAASKNRVRRPREVGRELDVHTETKERSFPGPAFLIRRL